jgi:crossover junction endodeoxyribonuclease RuvC
MFVLGVDPGLSRCGYGAVRRTRAGLEAVAFGVLGSSPDTPHPRRLRDLHRGLSALVAEHRPDVVVVERVFFQTNARTAIGVAQASGIALVVADEFGCEVAQYTSNEVKLAVTGDGAAEKRQTQSMVQRILGLAEAPKPFDAADALALAIHHLGMASYARTSSEHQRTGSSGIGVADANSGLGNARVATSFGGVRLAPPATSGARTKSQLRVTP